MTAATVYASPIGGGWALIHGRCLPDCTPEGDHPAHDACLNEWGEPDDPGCLLADLVPQAQISTADAAGLCEVCSQPVRP